MNNKVKSIRPRPFISIVVPIFKVEDYIEKCLQSILRRCANDPVYQLILVNDGTPDRSAHIASELTKNFTNVQIINQENAGLGAARNVGASASHGEYLWFIDSDDWIPEDAIDNVTEALRRRSPDVLNIAFETSLNTGMGFRNSAIPGKMYSGTDYLDISIVQNPVQYYLFRRSFYSSQRLSFKVGIYHEDALFTPLSISKAKSVMYLDKVCYIYNIRPNSITSSMNNIKKRAHDVLAVFEELMQSSMSNAGECQTSRVIGKYAGIAFGSVFYYYKMLPRNERRGFFTKVMLAEAMGFLLKTRQAKYALAFMVMYMDGKFRAFVSPSYDTE